MSNGGTKEDHTQLQEVAPIQGTTATPGGQETALTTGTCPNTGNKPNSTKTAQGTRERGHANVAGQYSLLNNRKNEAAVRHIKIDIDNNISRAYINDLGEQEGSDIRGIHFCHFFPQTDPWPAQGQEAEATHCRVTQVIPIRDVL